MPSSMVGRTSVRHRDAARSSTTQGTVCIANVDRGSGRSPSISRLGRSVIGDGDGDEPGKTQGQRAIYSP